MIHGLKVAIKCLPPLEIACYELRMSTLNTDSTPRTLSFQLEDLSILTDAHRWLHIKTAQL